MRVLAQILIDGLDHPQLIDNTRDDAQMVYRLNDDIDKTLSLSTMLMSIIVHYSECDNPEGGRSVLFTQFGTLMVDLPKFSK